MPPPKWTYATLPRLITKLPKMSLLSRPRRTAPHGPLPPKSKPLYQVATDQFALVASEIWFARVTASLEAGPPNDSERVELNVAALGCTSDERLVSFMLENVPWLPPTESSTCGG